MNRLFRLFPLFLLLVSCGERETSQAPAPAESAQTAEEGGSRFSGANAYAHCAALCALGPRPSGSEAYAKQLAYLRFHLEKAGWTVRERRFKLTDGSQMSNLHATFGDAEELRPLILTCHIDTKRIPGFIGADDGASAAALLVELARVLSGKPESAKAVEIIFFDGEESFVGRMSRENSLFGSRYEVIRRQADGSLPKWQINLDMVGGRDKMIAVPVQDTPTFMLKHYLQATESLGCSEADWTLYPGSYLDDHTPFADAGVATLNIIAYFGNSDWWHTGKDNMQRISARSLLESGRVTLRLTEQLLRAPQSKGDAEGAAE